LQQIAGYGRRNSGTEVWKADMEQLLELAEDSGEKWWKAVQLLDLAKSNYQFLSHIRFEYIDGIKKPHKRSKSDYNNEKAIMYAYLHFAVTEMQNALKIQLTDISSGIGIEESDNP